MPSGHYGLSEIIQLDNGEKALFHLAGSTWFAGFKLVVESGLVNINCINNNGQIVI